MACLVVRSPYDAIVVQLNSLALGGDDEEFRALEEVLSICQNAEPGGDGEFCSNEVILCHTIKTALIAWKCRSLLG